MPRKKKIVQPSCVYVESRFAERVGNISAREGGGKARPRGRERNSSCRFLQEWWARASKRGAAPAQQHCSGGGRPQRDDRDRADPFFRAACGVPGGQRRMGRGSAAPLRARPVSATPPVGSSNSLTVSSPGLVASSCAEKKAATTALLLPLPLATIVAPGSVIRIGS